jgi:ADP-ribosyl-[dinitrogen reductase] hydrolase
MTEVIDRAQGALVGLACGDALGTTGEFHQPGEFPPIRDMVGGGVFRLQPGKWTDDTSLALCLADSLLACGEFNSIDQLERYVRWFRSGYRSSIGKAFDVGDLTRQALTEYLGTGAAYPGQVGEWTAGNGSIMRLAPIPIFYSGAIESDLLKFSGLSSKTTHAEPICVEACQFMGLWIQRALAGASKEDLLNISSLVSSIEKFNGTNLHPELRLVLMGRYLDKEVPIISSGYVVHTLEVALWALSSTENFEDGLIRVVNLGGDADTAGAVYGQLAGAIYGLRSIPKRWLEVLYLQQEIAELAKKLLR